MRSNSITITTRMWSLVCGVLWAADVLAWTPAFSYMTLNGLESVAVSVEDIDRDLAVYGLTAERLRMRVTERLREAGLTVIEYDAALRAPEAALLRVRIVTNHDGHGFYHLSVKFELREKIPLGNAAGGFISQAVWSDAQNGVILANEVEKVDAIVESVLNNFVGAYQAERSPQE